ncbi:MAG TPA: branched-chain amino acid ABC transporter permease/ATP-binding protein [Acidimicrobiales bacterium]|nr:branched-chain amino acid ABC transporter permease/ATP-binding protein [Acidimicrobiales bacterium]
MSDLLPFIILGIVTGSVYGLTGAGLVLTYKTSGIFNFGQGSLGAVSAYVFYFLRVGHNMPWPLAAVISVFVLGPVMGLGLELLARRLAEHGTAVRVAGMLGIVLFVESMAFIWYGSSSQLYPSFLPTRSFLIAGTNIGTDQIIIIGISVVTTGCLYLFLRFRRMGMAMRAVVDNPDLLALMATSPVKVRRWSWIIGTTFAALAGVLLGPSVTLNATILTLLVVQAFGAAAIGRFSSLPLTYVGGLAIGIAAAISTKYANNISWLSGLPASLPFLVLVVALLFTAKDRLVDRWTQRPLPLPRSWHAPLRVRSIGILGAAAALATVPLFAGTRQIAFTAFLIYAILFLSLGLLVKTSGQVSLCHLGFAAVGAAAMGHLTAAGIPWGVALLMAAITAIPVGLIVAFSAIRLSGIFLALATYGFAILLEQLFYGTNLMFGTASGSGLSIPRPGVLSMATGRGYYYLVLGILLLTIGIIVLIQCSRFGRILLALSDSSAALETQGITTNLTKIMVFCLSASLAAVAGGLLGGLYETVNGTEFSSFSSLVIFVVLVLVVAGDPWYAFLCAAGLTIVPTYLNFGNINNYLSSLFGLAAIMLAYTVTRVPTVPARLRAFLGDRGGDSSLRPGKASVALDMGTRSPTPARGLVAGATPSPGLEVRNLKVSYGAINAVEDLSLKAPLGQVTGLIGPNGAGKTTTFSACSGLVAPKNGQVLLHGDPVTGLGVAARARRGLGRTFQKVQLWESLTVRENISMGAEAMMAGGRVWTQLVSRADDTRHIDVEVAAAVERTGIATLCDLPVSQLSTGQRRLVELARCLAGPFDVLLLDEPSSGLDSTETEAFGAILADVVADGDIGILLVEHDMSLVMEVCHYIYVMDFGELIFEGTPDAVSHSDIVRTAYLGEDISLGPPVESAPPSLERQA